MLVKIIDRKVVTHMTTKKTKKAVVKNQKLKTTVFWGALASSIVLLISAISLFFGVEIDSEKTQNLLVAIGAFIGALSLGGILINPKDVDSFQSMMVKKEKKK